MPGRGKRALVAAALALCCFLLAAAANAELIERGDLFVRFQGGIFPKALPRQQKAPITVSIDGTIKTLSGDRPPALRFISIAINRGGQIETKGLPTCRRSFLEPATAKQALAACGPALVGEGRYAAALALPEQANFPLQGRLLAFNAVVDGKRAILAHVYGEDPVPNSRVFVFHIHKTTGTFGTVLTASLPVSLNRHGYLKQISLDLRRDYVYRGRQRSYLSAACAAPAGFDSASFPFVRVGMTFSDGRKLASTLTRTCRVQG
ncbi:MAG TPA: hypothetical protein VFK14_01015 [Solirubrobacterales bacterium]|nr:hypothetical protein [Solirubrobacterales bacterium]